MRIDELRLFAPVFAIFRTYHHQVTVRIYMVVSIFTEYSSVRSTTKGDYKIVFPVLHNRRKRGVKLWILIDHNILDLLPLHLLGAAVLAVITSGATGKRDEDSYQ